MRKRRTAKVILVIMLLAAICGSLLGCKQEKSEFDSLDDFQHARIGLLTGSSFAEMSKKTFPEAECKYYLLVTDMVLSLEQGKIDGFLMDECFLAPLQWEKGKISYIDETIYQSSYGYVFKKGSHSLKEEINDFIAAKKADGTMEALEAKWFGESEPEGESAMVDLSDLKAEKGTLKMAVSSSVKPFVYVKNNTYTGFDVEFAAAFCREKGYGLEITDMTFEGIIPGVMTGKYDFGAAGITMTDERKEGVDFSETYHNGNVVMAIRSEERSTGFIDRMKENFEKTFIREARWKILVKGIGNTIFITVCAAALGTALGFGLYMLSRAWGRPVLMAAKVYTRIMAGTPIVVVLMILFYVIFGGSGIDGIWVAIMAFTLTVGASVYNNLSVSITGVDTGQSEAAYALGYGRSKTFFRIVLPQAMHQFMPFYQSELVSLIKGTSVVGYIAVEDLTKMSDIIRSSTYEAFFPLICTALIYFSLISLIWFAMGKVKILFEPKKRKREAVLKGVEIK